MVPGCTVPYSYKAQSIPQPQRPRNCQETSVLGSCSQTRPRPDRLVGFMLATRVTLTPTTADPRVRLTIHAEFRSCENSATLGFSAPSMAPKPFTENRKENSEFFQSFADIARAPTNNTRGRLQLKMEPLVRRDCGPRGDVCRSPT